jgi:hypothetical protein
MKIWFFFTLLFLGLARSDWLATGFCKRSSFSQGVLVENGDCTNQGIRGPNTYRYIQCTDSSYKIWNCNGDNCEDWARKNQPTETGALGVCKNGQMNQCFKSFNETAAVNGLFPRAKRVALAYAYNDWLNTFVCNGTVASVAISVLDVCVPLETSKGGYFMAQCNDKAFTESDYSDANCQWQVGDMWNLPVQQCEIGWYTKCIYQNSV